MNAIARPRERLEGVVMFLRMRTTKLANAALLMQKNWWDKYKNHFMK